jgi:YesN/AraC family two-component response regulator
VIVEDELIESESLRRIISGCVDNAVIYEAATGKKAIKLIDTLEQIDMMLVDINIPLPNGNQVIEYLKSKNNDTKVIVTTANDDFDIVRSMLNLKVDDYLLKPVKQSILTDTIKKTLDVNEDDVTELKALKQTMISLIENCDYEGWHSFLFKKLDDACARKTLVVEQRKTMTNILELLNYYISTQGEKMLPCGKKITALIHDITQHGLTATGYYRIMTNLMIISEEVFDQAFKNFNGNMDFTERAKFHIEKNVLKNLTLDDIASRSFVSTCYLSRAFKKNTGTGFSNYITNRKISIAKSLLQFSNLKVNTIALELSYQDANYFCRIFKKETGMAPSDYRKIVSPESY